MKRLLLLPMGLPLSRSMHNMLYGPKRYWRLNRKVRFELDKLIIYEPRIINFSKFVLFSIMVIIIFGVGYLLPNLSENWKHSEYKIYFDILLNIVILIIVNYSLVLVALYYLYLSIIGNKIEFDTSNQVIKFNDKLSAKFSDIKCIWAKKGKPTWNEKFYVFILVYKNAHEFELARCDSIKHGKQFISDLHTFTQLTCFEDD